MFEDSIEKPAVYGNELFRRERERRLGEDFGDALRDDVRLIGARFRSFGADGLGLVVEPRGSDPIGGVGVVE